MLMKNQASSVPSLPFPTISVSSRAGFKVERAEVCRKNKPTVICHLLALHAPPALSSPSMSIRRHLTFPPVSLSPVKCQLVGDHAVRGSDALSNLDTHKDNKKTRIPEGRQLSDWSPILLHSNLRDYGGWWSVERSQVCVLVICFWFNWLCLHVCLPDRLLVSFESACC